MQTISLNGIWNLRGRKEGEEGAEVLTLSACVPGCVQLDLSREGYLPADLFYAENIKKAEEYEEYEWWYETSFECPRVKNNVYLVFEGVDCIAEYYLNGEIIGKSENAFISHEFRIDRFLSDGENRLSVHILSPMKYAREQDYPIRSLLSIDPDGSYLRKPPHSFGWDIMPRAVTSGLWRGVSLEVRDEIYFSQVYAVTREGESNLFYTLQSDRDDLSGVEIELDCACGESSVKTRFIAHKRWGVSNFYIENPKLWYPYGYGEANIYDGKVRIYDRGELVHERAISFGVREVVLDRRDPEGEDNGQFRFLINGTEIMCRGSNWVPLDAFHCRDAERYDRALALVKDIGCNILRCWGGNVYEDHAFFDFCDRNGIMVWQDFAMACAQYPETEEFISKLRAEVASVVRKLRQHPSIVLWAGDNEVDACFPQYDPNDNYLTRHVIPACIKDNDLDRPYLPSSPYISKRMYWEGNRSQIQGSRLVEDHLWGPRDYFKSDFYRTNQAHFVSETGYHGCPSLESIKKFISPECVWPYKDNPEWILHSTDQKGNDSRVMLMEKQVRVLFGDVPTEPEDYILASQISQAEAKKYFIERMRVGRPDKTGIIWWNLLDGWPQMSDAVVDYYFDKKLAYSYIKRSEAVFTVAAAEPVESYLPIFACNDSLKERKGHLVVRDADSERVVYEGGFTAGANASTELVRLKTDALGRMIILEWSGDESGFNHYLLLTPPISLDWYRGIMERYGF